MWRKEIPIFTQKIEKWEKWENTFARNIIIS